MIIDILFVLVMLTGFYLGYSRGIIRTVFTILSLTLGLVAAFKFAPITTDFLSGLLKTSNPLMFIAGFLVTFVVTMILIRTVASGLEGLLEKANINFINQILGGVVTSGFMILVFSVLLGFANSAGFIDKKSEDGSRTYAYLKQYPAYVKEGSKHLWPILEDFWHESIDMMDKLEKMGERSESEDIITDYPDEESDNGADKAVDEEDFDDY